MPPKSPRQEKPARKPAAKRPRSPGRGGRKGSHSDLRIYLLLLAVVALLAGLVWLARQGERPSAPPPVQPAETRLDPAAEAREQAEAFLAFTAVPADAIVRLPAEHPRHYQIQRRPPAAQAVEALRQRLRQLVPPLVLTTPEDGVLVIADGSGKSLLTIQYLPVPLPPPKAAAPLEGKGGRVVIIMDDLGRGLGQARQLLALEQVVTFSILPGEPHATEVARMAHAAGREVMLHVPMEPQGFPVVDPGDDAIFVRQTDDELRGEMKKLLDRVPFATGANNHMGSRFTEDERAMAAVMGTLHERGLFFVDSLTSGHSVGAVTARRAGVPVLRRDVFLDNVAEVAQIRNEIRRLAVKAGRSGSAVGICHPYPETFQALREELPKLAGQGVKFVKVSALLKNAD